MKLVADSAFFIHFRYGHNEKCPFVRLVSFFNGSVVYTLMDLWDSPSVLACLDGNVSSGGNLVYRGGNVVEWKVDQVPVGDWRNYSLELTEYISSAWLLRPGDVLESVYVVVEAVGETVVTVKVDDLWISRLGWTGA
jgi:hypothetical protein